MFMYPTKGTNPLVRQRTTNNKQQQRKRSLFFFLPYFFFLFLKCLVFHHSSNKVHMYKWKCNQNITTTKEEGSLKRNSGCLPVLSVSGLIWPTTNRKSRPIDLSRLSFFNTNDTLQDVNALPDDRVLRCITQMVKNACILGVWRNTLCLWKRKKKRRFHTRDSIA